MNSLRLAAENKVKSVAFPSISTGAYGFPIKLAGAKIALTTVTELLTKLMTIERVIFVCFSKDDYNVYQRELAELN